MIHPSAGINESFVGKLEDGTVVFIKPGAGDPRGLYGRPPLGSTDSRVTEVAAFKVAQEMGIPMPATVTRTFKNDTAVVVEKANASHAVNLETVATFDFVIGNTDRHGANILEIKDGQLQPQPLFGVNFAESKSYAMIDHGLSFAENGTKGGNFNAIEAFTMASRIAQSPEARLAGKIPHRALSTSTKTKLSTFAARKAQVTQMLENLGISKAAASAMWQRVDYAMENGIPATGQNGGKNMLNIP